MKLLALGTASVLAMLFIGLTVSKLLGVILALAMICWFSFTHYRKTFPSFGNKVSNCPHCLEIINLKATKCPHCTSVLNDTK